MATFMAFCNADGSTMIQHPKLTFNRYTILSTTGMASGQLGTKDFNLVVYQIVRAIPLKRVITCEHIAKLVGFPRQTRRVREAVNFISHTNPPVAWHRVIPTSGIISMQGPNEQQHLLEAEGVEVGLGKFGESRVDLERWGWFPEANDILVGGDIGSETYQEWGA